jgi:hypothetical protein
LNLKLTPIILAVVGSSAILFGGWFVYHSVAMENPLNEALNGTPGVESSEASIGGDKVVFDLKLNSQAQLREIVHELEKKNSDVAGNRDLELRVQSNSSPALEEWWSRALFDVAQAMETSQYANIPASLEQKSGQLTGLKVQSEMDEKNVYIQLTEGEHVKFVILPRNPAKMGVWPNE